MAVDESSGKPVDGAAAAAIPPRVSLLPDIVRQRLVTLAADALEHLDADTLPPALRPVLSFARARRARLAAAALAVALDDEDFRRRVAAQVRPSRAGLAGALDNGEPVAADPVEVATLAYLLRPPSWTSLLATALDRIDTAQSNGGDPDTTGRLHSQLTAVREELAAVRAAHREQLAALKTENAELRRRIAAERTQARQARQAAETAAARVVHSRDDAARESAGVQAEQRRLRSRVEDLTRELQGLKQAERGSRADEAMRARLLLDTLVDAAHGLRRELALPPVEALPADTLGLPESGPEGLATVGSPRALSTSDPALLQHLVSLPRAHLLVDGYNVTKLGWPSTPLEAQRTRLLRELAPLAARSGTEVTVVFDGADLAHRPPVSAPRGIRVRFSAAGVTADDVLLDLVRAEPPGRPVVVVSSDGEVVAGATRAGARAVPSATLLALLGSRGARTVGGPV